MDKQCSHFPHGSVVGFPFPFSPIQLSPFAIIRAVVVFPVPRIPVKMKEWAIRLAAKEFFKILTIVS